MAERSFGQLPGSVTTDGPVDPDTESPAALGGARSEVDAPGERISLHGPTFKDVMAALHAVDPRKADPDQGTTMTLRHEDIPRDEPGPRRPQFDADWAKSKPISELQELIQQRLDTLSK